MHPCCLSSTARVLVDRELQADADVRNMTAQRESLLAQLQRLSGPGRCVEARQLPWTGCMMPAARAGGVQHSACALVGGGRDVPWAPAGVLPLTSLLRHAGG